MENRVTVSNKCNYVRVVTRDRHYFFPIVDCKDSRSTVYEYILHIFETFQIIST